MRYTIYIKEKVSDVSSSLLIPEDEVRKFIKMKKKFGDIRTYFHYLVFSKKIQLSIRPQIDNGKILYQQKGQNLKRFDFRPFQGDWERFRLIAQTYNMSMTMLFVILLQLIKGNSGGIPTKPPKLFLLQSLTYDLSTLMVQIRKLILYEEDSNGIFKRE